jgi:hypothetical protein
MSIAVLFDCPAHTLAQYDKCFEFCPELADQPARPYHMCVSSGTGFLVIDVWESAEVFARFDTRTVSRTPARARAGSQGSAQLPGAHVATPLAAKLRMRPEIVIRCAPASRCQVYRRPARSNDGLLDHLRRGRRRRNWKRSGRGGWGSA